MLRNAKELLGAHLRAKDGEIGKIDDVYFDEAKWTLRYFVVDAGSWLTERKVLVSPSVFGKPDWFDRSIPTKLMKSKIKKSPAVDLSKPLTREQEEALHQYYTWPVYWSGNSIPGFTPGPGINPKTAVMAQTQILKERARVQRRKSEKNLHSAKNVMGYHISALDGEIGHIDDFLVDDEAWAIRYVVVDTSNWLPGRRVVISPHWIKYFSWENSKVVVNHMKMTIKGSPDYIPDAPISHAYEEELYKHYGQEKYWGTEWEKAA